jgi:hypothetical protein
MFRNPRFLIGNGGFLLFGVCLGGGKWGNVGFTALGMTGKIILSEEPTGTLPAHHSNPIILSVCQPHSVQNPKDSANAQPPHQQILYPDCQRTKRKPRSVSSGASKVISEMLVRSDRSSIRRGIHPIQHDATRATTLEPDAGTEVLLQQTTHRDGRTHVRLGEILGRDALPVRHRVLDATEIHNHRLERIAHSKSPSEFDCRSGTHMVPHDAPQIISVFDGCIIPRHAGVSRG